MKQPGCERDKEQGSAKARLDCNRREARMTRGGPKEAGEVEDKDVLNNYSRCLRYNPNGHLRNL